MEVGVCPAGAGRGCWLLLHQAGRTLDSGLRAPILQSDSGVGLCRAQHGAPNRGMQVKMD